jgi:hypothetical protein
LLGGINLELEEMAKKIQIIEDTEAIKKLHYRYLNSLIHSDFDGIIKCFDKDSALDLGEGSQQVEQTKGIEEIAKRFKDGILVKAHVGREGLFMVHPIVEVNGEKATGSWLTYFMQVRDKGIPTHWMQGYYDCTYKKVNGEWKFDVLKWRARLKYREPRIEYSE